MPPPPNTPEEGVPVPAPVPASRSQSRSSSRPRSSAPSLASSPSSSSSRSPSPLPSPSPPASASIPRTASGALCITSIDYSALEYTDPVDETLICPICHNPFCKPVTTRTCGHTFCRACLKRATEDHPICPIDRLPLNFPTDHYTPRIVGDQLDRLRVMCPNRLCDVVTTRSLLPSHYQRYCKHTPVHCPDPTCREPVARADALPEKGCLHRDTMCPYCKKTVQVAALATHHHAECENHTVRCAHCDAAVVRHEMPDHVAKGCPETETRCRWQQFGCTLVARRRCVDDHERSGCVYQAIGRLMRDRTEDRRLIADLKGQLAYMEDRVRRAEQQRAGDEACFGGVPGPSDMRRRGSADMAELDLGAGPSAERPGNPPPYGAHDGGGGGGAAWGSPEDYMLAQFERMENRVEDLRKSLSDLESRQRMLLLSETMPLKDQLAEMRSSMGVIGMHTTWLMNAHRQSRGQQQQQQQQQQREEQRANTTAGVASVTTGGSRPTATTSGGGGGGYAPRPRRMSDGRGDHPPRL